MRILAVVLLVWLAATGCGKNPRYCDEATPCQGSNQVCDYLGVCPESDFLTNSCIPEAAICWDAGPAPQVDATESADAEADAGCSAGEWLVEPVDTTSDVGACPAIAIDAAGGVHMIYFDETAMEVNYAHRTPAGEWSVVGLANDASGTCLTNSVSVDGSGGVHALFKNSDGTENLTYGYKPPAGTWQLTVLEDTNSYAPAMVVDGAGGVHVAYYRFYMSMPELRYATKPALGTWDNTLVESIDQVPWMVLAVGGSALHLAYLRKNGSNFELRHAGRETTTWDFEASPYLNLGPSIVADGADTVHGVATDLDDVIHLQRTAAGVWSMEPIFDQNPAVNVVARGLQRIALDADGVLHTAFPDHDRIAYSSKAPAGTWATTTLAVVDPGGVPSNAEDLPGAAITVDASGGVHAAYYDPGPRDVYYARLCR